MAEQNYKNNEPIDLIYQAPNKESGLTGVIAKIILPSGFPDSNFPDENLIERGSTGTYHGTFTPNQVGDWQLIFHKADGSGQVTKTYSVGDHNVNSVGAAILSVDSKLDDLDAKVSDMGSPPMVG